jgi:hypothetical protein
VTKMASLAHSARRPLTAVAVAADAARRRLSPSVGGGRHALLLQSPLRPAASAGGRLRATFAAAPPWPWVFALYLAVALATIGRAALVSPAHVCACDLGVQEAPAYMWSLAWWPHALLSGIDPLYSHAIWAPGGVDVAGANTVPIAALALWPVTALFGVVASYDVLAIAAPALSALSAFLLCRRLTSSTPAALAGGYLFGFGSYELSQSLGHPNLTLLFLLPAMVHLALRRVDGELTRRRFVALMAVALGVQALTSTEIAFDVGLLGAIALIAARCTAPLELRLRVETLAREVFAAGVIAAAVISPYLVAVLAQHQVFRGGDVFGLNLANLVVPTAITRYGSFRSLAKTFEIGDLFEAGGYLGVPLLLALCAWARGSWRSRSGRLLLIMLAVSLLLALGSPLHVGGRQLIPLPWALLQRLPPFASLVPSRLMGFVDLIVAICIALWLRPGSGGRPALRWLVVFVGAVALLPDVSVPATYWASRPSNPAFFTTSEYQRYLQRGEEVLTIPFAGDGDSMLWQAETGFYFDMPGGYLSQGNAGTARDAEALAVLAGGSQAYPPAHVQSRLVIPVVRAYLREHDIRRIVMLPAYQPIWQPVLDALAGPPRAVGGIVLYSVDARSTPGGG